MSNFLNKNKKQGNANIVECNSDYEAQIGTPFQPNTGNQEYNPGKSNSHTKDQLVLVVTHYNQSGRQLSWESASVITQNSQGRPGLDCVLKTINQLHEIKKRMYCKFKLKLKKVGKATRPFKYDLNQIPYDYSGNNKQIQGIRSDRVPEELWTEVHNIVQEVMIKTIPKKKKCKECKMVV